MSSKEKSFKGEILQTIGKLIDRQNDKGFQKYGHSLEKCDPGEYDWNVMIIEELIDALQYQQKEIERLRAALQKKIKENARLRQALESIGYKGFNVEPKRIVVKMQSLARKALEESK